jgi:hypothetical protein
LYGAEGRDAGPWPPHSKEHLIFSGTEVECLEHMVGNDPLVKERDGKTPLIL